MNQIFDHKRWLGETSRLRSIYQTDRPFPHIMVENFLVPEAARKASAEYSLVDWQSYRHYNENKQGGNTKTLPPKITQVIAELNSPEFLSFLTALTGIEGLIADPSLASAGPHQSERGGFLNIHADFTVHPYRHEWKRRLNVLVYLADDWQEAWGGQLELWSRDMQECQARYAPLFNRCVIFSTDEASFHGHPEPMVSPAGVKRKSIALYYYTLSNDTVAISTEYRPRPNDKLLKSTLIFMDKLALRAFHKAKSRFNLSDRVVTSFMNFFNKKKK